MSRFHPLRAFSGSLGLTLSVMSCLLIPGGAIGSDSATNQPYPVFGTSWVSKLGVEGAVQYWPQVMVPMRDDVRLSTGILLPKGFKPPYPTVPVRTP